MTYYVYNYLACSMPLKLQIGLDVGALPQLRQTAGLNILPDPLDPSPVMGVLEHGLDAAQRTEFSHHHDHHALSMQPKQSICKTKERKMS